MKTVNLAALAAFVLLAAGPALAGDPRGGHPGGGCGGGCGGGGHRPPAHGGGYGGNINVNVNANANASAYAGASARGYVNARAYDMGGYRGGYRDGGTVYVGGGYGGEVGGYYGGGAIYNEEAYAGRACASAPFGYVVGGFGREGRRAPTCVAGASVCRESVDRGGRYGYSEHRGCDGGRREHHEGGYGDSSGRGSYEYSESYSETYREEAYSYAGGHAEGGYGIGDYERGYIDGSRSCGECRVDEDRGGSHPPRDRDRDHSYGYEQPYAPAPTYPAPRHDAPPYQPSAYEAPMTPNQYYGLGDQPPPPRQHYSQEPGERG